MFARYHKEGTDPHRQTPNRNGNLTGDKENNAKAKNTKDSGGGIETRTGGLDRDDKDHKGRDNSTKTSAAKCRAKKYDKTRTKRPKIGTGSSTKDLTGTPDSANNPTDVQRAIDAKSHKAGQHTKDDRTKTRDSRDHEEGDNSGNTTVMRTKPLRKSNNQRLQSNSFQRAGTEMRRAQKDGETRIGEPKTLKDGNTKNPTGASNNSETPAGKQPNGDQARDQDKENDNDPKQDTQHAKATDNEDNTASGSGQRPDTQHGKNKTNNANNPKRDTQHAKATGTKDDTNKTTKDGNAQDKHVKANNTKDTKAKNNIATGNNLGPRQRAKKNGKTRSEGPKTLTDGSTKNPNKASNNTKDDPNKATKNSNAQDKHAKASNTKDTKAKNNTGTSGNPGPDNPHGKNGTNTDKNPTDKNARDHSKESAKTNGGRAKKTTEKDNDGGHSKTLGNSNDRHAKDHGESRPGPRRRRKRRPEKRLWWRRRSAGWRTTWNTPSGTPRERRGG